MKNATKNNYTLIKGALLLLFGVLVLGGCQTKLTTDIGSKSQKLSCDTVTNIEGTYTCTGECVVIGEDGKKTVVTVSGETDSIIRFPGAKENLYQVNITGSNNFHEIEIGALTGLTLRTATAEVSDGQFPVLEEYVFDTDSLCRAIGFTKIVRNPNPGLFKTCVIYAKKITN